MRRIRNHKRWAQTLVAAALLAMLATGCLKAEIDIKVDDDGSGDVTLLRALDTDSMFGVLAEMDIPEESVGSSDDLCEEFTADTGAEEFPVDAQIEPYEEDGFCGTRVTYSLRSSSDQSLAIEPAFDSEARLYKEGENWFFDVPVDLSEVTDDSAEIPDEMFNAMFESASFTVNLDLPGRAIDGENNADSVGDDGKFEWEIDFLNPPARLFAQTEPGSGGGSGGGFPFWILGLIALLALAGVGAWRLMNRDTDDAATSLDGYPAPTGDLNAQGVAMPGADAFAGAQRPAVDMPPPATASPQDYAPPVQPANPSAQETVMLDSGATAAAAAAPVDATPAAAAPVADAKPVPVYDEALGAWIVNHPQHGRLVHDPASDTWRPV